MKHNKFKLPVVAWAIVGVAVVIWGLVILHYTPARFWFDPVQNARDWRLVQSADTSVERANAYLSIAEDRFKDFKAINKNNSSDSRLEELAAEMVENDQKAMAEMDSAKKSGVDIKYLVKRLCDGLEAQYDELSDTKHSQKSELGKLHAQIEEVEAGLEKSTSDVKKALDDAMMW